MNMLFDGSAGASRRALPPFEKRIHGGRWARVPSSHPSLGRLFSFFLSLQGTGAHWHQHRYTQKENSSGLLEIVSSCLPKPWVTVVRNRPALHDRGPSVVPRLAAKLPRPAVDEHAHGTPNLVVEKKIHAGVDQNREKVTETQYARFRAQSFTQSRSM